MVAEASRFGYVPYELEGRLALYKLELQSGDTGARSRLVSLQSEALAIGFRLISRKAQLAAATNK